MSRRMRTTTTHVATWNQNARDAPMRAASSGLRGEPEDVGRAVLTLARGDLSYATGNVLMIDGGLTIRRL